MKTIGLCLMVKDKSKVIMRCLESARQIVDYVLVEDTGSTDGTQTIIREWLDRVGLPGEVYDEPWRDFAYNRSHALARLRKKEGIDYALILDADDYIEFEPDFDIAAFKSSLHHDVYSVELRNERVRYSRDLICSNRRPFRCRGVLHEFLEGPPDASASSTKGFYISSAREGARSQDPDKYHKDAALLEQALQIEQDPFLRSRYTFYLARSYRNAGENDRALQFFLKRAELGYGADEVFMSLYDTARLQEAMGRPFEEVIAAYLRASDTLPSRAEALHAASRLCRANNKFEDGYDYARRGLTMALPKGGLFVEPWVYDYGLLDEFAVHAYWTERYQDCLEACQRLLREGKMPSNMRDRVRKNAEFAAEKIRLERIRSQTLAAVTTVSVIIPSRLARVTDGGEKLFLQDAVESIRQQATIERHQVQVVVGVDTGTIVPADLAQRLGIELVDSGTHGQAAALNAAAKRAEGECLAILEDDDMWDRMFLRTALDALSKAEFLSCTQLELDEKGEVLRINDFPTPSGWVMRRETFQAIGGFDESLRWHIENDWLGRLGETSTLRVHLVESTAPILPQIVEQVRPWLHNLLRLGRPAVHLVRHVYPVPLIVRRIHVASIMHRTPREGSQREITRLVQKYERIPW